MKKPVTKTKQAKATADEWGAFPRDNEAWTEEERNLEWLVRGLKMARKSSGNPLPYPPMLYVPMMQYYFKWIRREIADRENPDAVERLYYLALLSVSTLLDVCEVRPDLFRPIARKQLIWPSMTGWGADVERSGG